MPDHQDINPSQQGIQMAGNLQPASQASNQPQADTIRTREGKLTIHKRKPILWGAIGKIVFVAFSLTGIIAASLTFAPDIVSSFLYTEPLEENVLLTMAYQPVRWKDFGNVFEPKLKILVQYPEEGFKDVDFLLDSGAVVSSLPREEAKELGLSLAKLPRSTFSGFGGTLSFAYRGEITTLMGEQEFVIPVVFTEAAGTKPLLGRSGFFEQFSVYFNHRAKRIEIRK